MLDRDWLAAGKAIEQRLADQVRALRLVASLTDIERIEERVRSQTPAAFVVYGGDRFNDQTPNGMGMGGSQDWVVFIAIRNAATGGDNSRLDAEAGPLIVAVANALTGWAPFDGGRPLKRITPPRPGYRVGFAYYPLAFNLDFSIATPRR